VAAGNAALKAARAAREEIFKWLPKRWKPTPRTWWLPAENFRQGSPDAFTPFEEAVNLYQMENDGLLS